MNGRAPDLASQVVDARARTLELMADLTDPQLLGPRLAIVNPMLWEAAHVAWFQERWVLRTAWKQPALYPEADGLYDSSAVPHDTRWDLPLFPRGQVGAYLREVRDRILEHLASVEPLPQEASGGSPEINANPGTCRCSTRTASSSTTPSPTRNGRHHRVWERAFRGPRWRAAKRRARRDHGTERR